MVRRSLGLCLAATALTFIGVLPTSAGAQELEQAYIRMNASSYEAFNAAINKIEDSGAVIRHRFYPVGAIGLIDAGQVGFIRSTTGVRRVFVGEIPDYEITGLDDREVFLMRAYNNIFFSPVTPPRQDSMPEVEPVPIDPGPLQIPEKYLDDYRAALKKPWQGAPGVPPPFPQATSEYMLGHIAVAAILPESEPGFGSQDWADSEEEKATEEVISAMDWWARHSPNQELRFSYEMDYAVPVQVEPMSNPVVGQEEPWAHQSLVALGYPGDDYFVQARDYINDMRDKYDADWGFIVFIVHGIAGQQFGNALAYAYLGGPLNVNVYSNGYLGPGNLDRVIAHESGHTFYTLDEYASYLGNCSERSGYLNVENANKLQGGLFCKSNVPCVMRSGSQPTPFDVLDPCYYTQGQVGWRDTDGDGIPDILDMVPKVNSVRLATPHSTGASVDTVSSVDATYRGSVSSVAYPNNNSKSFLYGMSFTVEPVGAEYRVDGGPWEPCEATDGRFDETQESFEATPENLVPRQAHTIEFRAVTAHGNVTPDSTVTSFKLVLDHASAPPLQLLSSNPAKPPVSIGFEPLQLSGVAGEVVDVEVAVYDLLGRKVQTLESGKFRTGRIYRTSWNGKDVDGRAVRAGVYAVAMSSQGQVRARKVLVIP